MVYANSLEIRTDDNRLICMARLIEVQLINVNSKMKNY